VLPGNYSEIGDLSLRTVDRSTTKSVLPHCLLGRSSGALGGNGIAPDYRVGLSGLRPRRMLHLHLARYQFQVVASRPKLMLSIPHLKRSCGMNCVVKRDQSLATLSGNISLRL
jgi:hypothetical protein